MGAQQDSAISPPAASLYIPAVSAGFQLDQAVASSQSSAELCAFPQALTLVQIQLGSEREVCFRPLVVALTPAALGALSAYTPLQAIGMFYTDTTVLFEVP